MKRKKVVVTLGLAFFMSVLNGEVTVHAEELTNINKEVEVQTNQQDDEDLDVYTYGSTRSNLNLRDNGSLDGNVLEVIPMGAEIEFCIQENSDWYKVMYKEYMGYAHKDYIVPGKIGYTTANLNLRESGSLESDILDVIPMGTEINYSKVKDSDWLEVSYKEFKGYVHKDYVTKDKVPASYRDINLPSHKDFKSFMRYTAITKCTQYTLQQFAYDGNYGIRMVNNRYCVAIGTASGASVGDYCDLILENGTVIECIVSDFKANCDTDASNLITVSNGCCSEFIVNLNVLDNSIKLAGSVSACRKDWQSPVRTIRVYNKNFFD